MVFLDSVKKYSRSKRMRSAAKPESATPPTLTPFTIAFVYCVVAGIYIITSDRLLLWIIPDVTRQTQFQTIKGWAYVAITALLLYFLIAKAFRALEHSIRERTRAEARLRTILDSERDAVLAADTSGRITACNTAASRLLGCGGATCVGETLDSVIAPEFRERFVIAVAGIVDRTLVEPPVFESAALRRDGVVIPVECLLAAGHHNGEAFVLCSLRDVSARKDAERERRRLEMQLRTAQRMEALGTLASGIAHDFNNSLAAILGYTELALMDTPGGSPLRDDLEQVLVAGQRAKELVLQILTFSRQAEHDLAPVALAPVVKETAKLLQGMLPSTITVREEITVEHATVLGDGTRLHQVLMNLCTNAYQAMSEHGGTLSIGLEVVDNDGSALDTAPGLAAGKYARVAVSDTGHGMTPALLDRVFDPFFTTRQDSGGTGLGLAVVHGIVKSHGGHITVSSEVGKGTTFHVYLPLVPETGDSAATEVEPLQTGSEHILVVDDEQLLAVMMKKALETLGYSVTAVTSPEVALETVGRAAHEFDLAITDQTMPGMTGEMLARALSRVRPGLPIILITGFADNETRTRAQKAGVRAVLLKPATLRELSTNVRRVLDASKSGSPSGPDGGFKQPRHPEIG